MQAQNGKTMLLVLTSSNHAEHVDVAGHGGKRHVGFDNGHVVHKLPVLLCERAAELEVDQGPFQPGTEVSRFCQGEMVERAGAILLGHGVAVLRNMDDETIGLEVLVDGHGPGALVHHFYERLMESGEVEVVVGHLGCLGAAADDDVGDLDELMHGEGEKRACGGGKPWQERRKHNRMAALP